MLCRVETSQNKKKIDTVGEINQAKDQICSGAFFALTDIPSRMCLKVEVCLELFPPGYNSIFSLFLYLATPFSEIGRKRIDLR